MRHVLSEEDAERTRGLGDAHPDDDRRTKDETDRKRTNAESDHQTLPVGDGLTVPEELDRDHRCLSNRTLPDAL
jgi:hypothetical protein